MGRGPHGGAASYEAVMRQACDTFPRWRALPAPKRGQIVREIGQELRQHKEDLGALVGMEMGQDRGRGPGRKCRK